MSETYQNTVEYLYIAFLLPGVAQITKFYVT